MPSATVLATKPKAADSQASAKENAATMPATANQSTTEACGRKPTSSATAVTTVVVTSVRRTLPPICPVRRRG
jgi:hypothetical protein